MIAACGNFRKSVAKHLNCDRVTVISAKTIFKSFFFFSTIVTLNSRYTENCKSKDYLYANLGFFRFYLTRKGQEWEGFGGE